MPWSLEDNLDKYKKDMTPVQKKQWVATANSVREQCIKDGGEPDKCDVKAIRIANGVVKESAMDKIQEATKTEDGQSFPASDYAYVPDPDKPSTWKLRLTKSPGGEPDAGIVGAACAALGKGFRGQRVEIPSGDLAKVKAKVRVAWKKANPDKDAEDMPEQIKESFVGDVITLIETKDDKVVPIKIIKPGWGSSGYYPEETLRRDGPAVFKVGTKMYWDHPTATEASERPERSLRDLAGEFVSDAEWKDAGPAGAGLYASAKVFEPFKAAVKELTPHIGVSIRAAGIAEEGEADGQKGMIVEEITDVASVDFVTVPDAGGKIVELFESYRDPDLVQRKQEMEQIKILEEAKAGLEAKLAEKEQQLSEVNTKLEEAGDSLRKAEESLLLKQSAEFVATKLADVELPELTKKRLVEKLSVSPILTEDKKLDEEKFGEEIDKAVTEEKEYLSQVLGSGEIKGMGEISEKDKPSLVESFKSLYLARGFSEEEAMKMAKIAGE